MNVYQGKCRFYTQFCANKLTSCFRFLRYFRSRKNGMIWWYRIQIQPLQKTGIPYPEIVPFSYISKTISHENALVFWRWAYSRNDQVESVSVLFYAFFGTTKNPLNGGWLVMAQNDNIRQMLPDHMIVNWERTNNHDERDGTSKRLCLALLDNKSNLNIILQPGNLSSVLCLGTNDMSSTSAFVSTPQFCIWKC